MSHRKLARRLRRFLSVFLSVFFNFILLSSLCMMSFPRVSPVMSAGEDWLEGFTYRKAVTVQQVTGLGTLNNYQVNLTVFFGSGTDDDQRVFLEGLSQSDFDDLRFCSEDGDDLLDAWADTDFYHSGYNATIWVEIQDDLGADNVTFYLYYGNSTVENYWNGTNTFLFWDDFDTGYSVNDEIDEVYPWRWTFENELHASDGANIKANPDATFRPNSSLSCYWVEAGDAAAGFKLHGDGWNDNGDQFGDKNTLYENIAIHAWFRVDEQDFGASVAMSRWFYGSSDHNYLIDSQSLGLEYTTSGSPVLYSPSQYYPFDTWIYNINYLHGNVSGDTDIAWYEGSWSGLTAHDGAYKTDGNGFKDFQITGSWGTEMKCYIDQFFIRRCKWTGIPENPPNMVWGEREGYTPPPEPWGWSVWIQGKFSFIIGLIGIILLLMSPSYMVWYVKKGDLALGAFGAFMLAFMGISFIWYWVLA